MMKYGWGKAALVALVLTLGGCGIFDGPKEAMPWQAGDDSKDTFYAEGRLAVKVDEKGSYAPFEWLVTLDKQEVTVKSPLGNTLGVLCEDAQGVIAAGQNEVYEDDSAENLSQRLLGFSLPLDKLHFWANGRWLPNEPHHIDASGRLQQLGWTIERSATVGVDQPRLLVLDRPGLTLRLVFDAFAEAPEDAEALCSIRQTDQ
ncbi:MAG: outer membrane lipoprotein LolB [Neisseriaceae bacterium]|nr:outer membrane lipoprotein LolB [Neisseriaceae bacterium]